MLRRRGHEVVEARSYFQAVEALKGAKFDEMYLDHDLECYQTDMYGSRELTGYDFVKYLATLPEDKHPDKVTVHSWNPDGAQRMKSVLMKYVCRVDRAPFNELWV